MLNNQRIAASLAALFVACVVGVVAMVGIAGVSSVADAAGLGRINVLSRMGQPFVAEIELVNVNKDDLATLNASLAPSAAYQAANINFDQALNSLRLTVQRRANGSAYIRATSWRPVNEPYLDLMVDVSWNGGKFRRQYAALLDMPTSAEAATAAASAATKAQATSRVATADASAAPQANAESKPPRKQRTPRAAKPAATKDGAAAPVLAMPGMPGTPGASTTPAAAAAAQKPETKPLESASTATPPASKPEPNAAPGKSEAATTVATKADRPDAGKGDAPKGDPTADTSKATPVTPAEPVKADTKEPATTPAPDPADPKAESAPVARPQPTLPRAAPPAPPAPPEPGVIDKLMKYGLWIVGAILALLLALAGFWGLGAWRRRKQANEEAAAAYPRFEPSVVSDAQAPTPAVNTPNIKTPTTAAVPASAAPASLTVANVTNLVDPVDEAKVYVNYGQFAQAENILRVAMSKEPGREAIQMALLELLAKRGNKDGFNQIAGRLHKETGGVGDNWKRAATLGYTLDPAHPLYSPPSSAARADAPGPMAASDETTMDIDQILAMNRTGLDPVAPPITPLSEFNIELPPADTPATGKTIDASTEEASMALDFKVELLTAPATPAPTTTLTTAPADDKVIEFVPTPVPASNDDVVLAFMGAQPAPTEAPVSARPKDDNSLEFKIEPAVTETKVQATPDVADPVPEAKVVEDVVERELLRSTKMRQVEPVKDERWHDVQLKFELVRAYQEMGDKTGVREVLDEIERDGDAEQKAEAKKIALSIE